MGAATKLLSVPPCQRTGMGLRQEAVGWKVGRNSQISFGWGCLCHPLCKVTSEKKGRDAAGHNFKQSVSRSYHTNPWEMFTSPCEVVYNTYNISIYCTICQHSSFYQPHQRSVEEVMYGTTYDQQQCHKALLCSLGCLGYPTMSQFRLSFHSCPVSAT